MINSSFQDNWWTMGHVGYLWMWMVQVGKIPKWGRQFPFLSERLGRCIGPAKHSGNAMSQHILTDTGKLLPLRTIQWLTPADINSSVEDEKRNRFNLIIRGKFGDSLRPPTPSLEEPSKYDDIEEPSKIPEADDFAGYSLYIHSEVLLSQNGDHVRAARAVDRTNN